MAGAELIGKEEIKEIMDVMETGILMRYGFDKERKGVFKVQELKRPSHATARQNTHWV